MNQLAISDYEFTQFQTMIYDIAGISMSSAKKTLVSGRLAKRIKHHGMNSYDEYFKLIMNNGGDGERQVAIDLLTTNETYFFREPKHFEFLKNNILPGKKAGATFRIWCAASSSGEEPYTLAMMLADNLGEAPWEIVASDLSTRVLEKAQQGLYPMERAENIPERFLKAYCLKGVGSQEGMFVVDKRLRSKVRFMQINLNEALPGIGEFDAVFLRNVMIYFDMETKRQVVNRIFPLIKPGGWLVIGHSESLNGVTDVMKSSAPSVYRKA